MGAGCTEQAPAPGSDRALERLRTEVDRESTGAAVARAPDDDRAPHARLAGLAAGVEDGGAAEGPVTLLEDARAAFGKVTLRAVEATASHRVSGPSRLSLTSEELFLVVTVAGVNTGPSPVQIDFGMTELGTGEARVAVAADAQRLAGSKELAVTLAPGQERAVSLVYEVPSSAPARHLTLHFPPPPGGNQDVPLRLK
jgi:hypothetical protein